MRGHNDNGQGRHAQGKARLRRIRFHRFLAEHAWLKGVPNFLTVCNSLCGFAAILNATRIYDAAHTGQSPRVVLAVSACLVLGAMVFDALDGYTARILKAASLKGLQMDSLSDMVTFGVAPALLVSLIAINYAKTAEGVCAALLFSAIYIASAAHRLARYNVQTMFEQKSGTNFSGLPSPGAAAGVCSVTILVSHMEDYLLLARALPVYAAVLGFLMVSNVRYPHMGKWLESVRRNRLRLAILLAAFAALLVRPLEVSVAIVNGYILWGLATGLPSPNHRPARAADDAPSPLPPPSSPS